MSLSESDDLTRRGFLAAGVLGASAAALASSSVAGRAAETEPRSGDEVKVRYAELLPHEFRQRLAERPIAYLPLGTLEWHGEHLPLGADAIQCEALLVACAQRLGGIVLPPIYLGPDRAMRTDEGSLRIGADNFPQVKAQLEGSCYWVSPGLHMALVDATLEQVKRAGFRAVFADGHGPSRRSWAQSIPERQERFGLKLLGVTDKLTPQWQSQMDHAARNETSLMLYYRPDLVDLSQLPPDRSTWPRGVSGQDPRDATAQQGQACFESSLELVRQMFAEAGLL